MSTQKGLIGFAAAGLMAGVVAVGAFSVSQAEERHNGGRAAQAQEAGAQEASQRSAPRCLDGSRVGRFHVVDDHTLLVYDDFGNPYRMDVGGPCRGMSDFSTFGFEFNGGSDICKAHDATLLRREPPTMGTMRCMINGFESISRAEAAELDKG